MPEDGAPERGISRNDIVEIAGIFDRYEFAIDPTSEDCRQAEAEFEDRVRQIFEEKIAPYFPDVQLRDFRCHVRVLCRRFIQKEMR